MLVYYSDCIYCTNILDVLMDPSSDQCYNCDHGSNFRDRRPLVMSPSHDVCWRCNPKEIRDCHHCGNDVCKLCIKRLACALCAKCWINDEVYLNPRSEVWEVIEK